MSLLDRILGRKKAPKQTGQPTTQKRPGYPRPSQGYPAQYGQQSGAGPPRPPGPPGQRGRSRARSMSPAEQALARYRYMLRTAPSATIEQAHAEAFAKLTPQQRSVMRQQLSAYLTPEQRAAGLGLQDDPASLARAATVIEIHRPGTLESIYRSMSTMPAAPGAPGTPSTGTFSSDRFMNTFMWLFLGGIVAHQFFADPMYGAFDPAGAAGYDAGDSGSADFGGGLGSDFGGGDFGDLGGIL
jgi:hypothetical protein